MTVRALTLYASVLAGGRVLGRGGSAPWRRVDIVVGALFLTGSGYYLLRVLRARS